MGDSPWDENIDEENALVQLPLQASTPTSTTSVVWPADVVRDAVNHELVHSGDTDVVEVLHRLLDRQRHLHHCQRLLHEAIEEALRWVRLPRHGEALNANIHERNIWSTIVAEARFGSAASSSGTRTWVNSQVALLLPDLPRDVANLRHALPGEADDTEAGFRRRAWRTHATNLYQKEGRPMPRGRWPSEDDRDLLRHGRAIDQQQAAAGLASMARRKAEHPSKWMSEAVPLLVEAVAAGETMELREHAARALANLPMCEMSNAHCIVEAGGVPPLVHLLAVESYGCRAQAARAVGNLCEAAKRAMRAGVVRPLLAALLTEDPALNGINLAVEAALALANFSNADADCSEAVLQSAVAIPGLRRLALTEAGQGAAAQRALQSLAQTSLRARQALDAVKSDEMKLKMRLPYANSSPTRQLHGTSPKSKVYGRTARPVPSSSPVIN
eukprot:s2105_g2.t1